MGKVPIPVCAESATAKEQPGPTESATNMEVLKFFPKPPYSSGIDTANKPSAPALSIKLTISPSS